MTAFSSRRPFGLISEHLILGATLAGLWVVLIQAGRSVASGNVRIISLAIVAVAALLAAQARPMTHLAVLIAVTPLPLYIRGLGASLTPAIVFGVWLSLLLPKHRANRMPADTRRLRFYAPALALVVATTLLSLARAGGGEMGANVGAFGRLVVGVAIFAACLGCIRSAADVRRAFVALAVAGVVVLSVAALQLALPSLTIPGLLSGAGSVRVERGAENFRLYGPVGDYELLGEMLALTAVVASFFALRSHGPRRFLWASLVPLYFVGIAATSTRSSFAILALGISTLYVAMSRIHGRRALKAAALVALGLLGAIPTITLLQQSFGTGYLVERLQMTPTTGGFATIIGPRAQLWSWFLEQLPDGLDLLLGTGPAFDYERFQTYPHSLPLTLLFTVGILGAIAFYGLFATIALRCYRTWRSSCQPYALIGALLVVLIMINELKIEYVREFNYQWFVWAILGVSAASAMPLADDGR